MYGIISIIILISGYMTNQPELFWAAAAFGLIDVLGDFAPALKSKTENANISKKKEYESVPGERKN